MERHALGFRDGLLVWVEVNCYGEHVNWALWAKEKDSLRRSIFSEETQHIFDAWVEHNSSVPVKDMEFGRTYRCTGTRVDRRGTFQRVRSNVITDNAARSGMRIAFASDGYLMYLDEDERMVPCDD